MTPGNSGATERLRWLVFAWRGSLGDEAITSCGLIALAFDAWGNHGFTPLSVAVLALFLLQNRHIDRAGEAK